MNQFMSSARLGATDWALIVAAGDLTYVIAEIEK
jgi:hypothetical protein